MTHRLLSAAAARLGASASTSAVAAGTTPVTPPAAAAPAASQEEQVDVVTLADAQAAVAAARAEGVTEGATAERNRTAGVLASDGGKANPAMAAFMLANNPAASADAISKALADLPKGAPAAEAPAKAPVAETPAITTPLSETPKIDAGAAPNGGGAEGTSQKDTDAIWDTALSKASATGSGMFGGEIAPGVPRTGN